MEPQTVLRGGLRAQLRIRGKSEQNSFRIPSTALVSRYDAHWLLLSDGTQKKVILLGTTEDGKDAIISSATLTAENHIFANPGSSTKD